MKHYRVEEVVNKLETPEKDLSWEELEEDCKFIEGRLGKSGHFLCLMAKVNKYRDNDFSFQKIKEVLFSKMDITEDELVTVIKIYNKVLKEK